MPQRILACKALFYTATVANTPKSLQQGLGYQVSRFGHARLSLAGNLSPEMCLREAERGCPLVIVDEADRLSLSSFEHLRDLYDRLGFGLILLGMPGLEKRLARYPQLYSRIGFVHELKPLSDAEMRFIIAKHAEALGLRVDPDRFSDLEAVATAIRITRGNFRLIERLFDQIRRIIAINGLNSLSAELVEAARNCLVIGSAD